MMGGMQPVAITREVSPALGACELTHLPRVPIDVDRARAQHHAYEDALRAAGYLVVRLPAAPELPDSVFVEDAAVVFDEVAVITRPGAESRRPETAAVAEALARYRTLRSIEAPGTLDGGDVLVIGRRVFVGLSSRTNDAAAAQLRAIVEPFGYTVGEATVRECLHLKSAATALSDRAVLLNPDWVDTGHFRGFDVVEVDPGEPAAANAVRLSDGLIFPAAFPRTAERLRARGFRVDLVEAGELAKAEGAVTCCSLIVNGGSAEARRHG
jgi:dimethylargininase